MVLHPFNRIFGLGDKSDSKAEKETYHPDEVIQIPVNKIEPNRFQPRSIFDEEKIAELAQTLHTHGMIQRSEEHTSELQSRGHLVCRLLLEKKNNNSRYA